MKFFSRLFIVYCFTAAGSLAVSSAVILFGIYYSLNLFCLVVAVQIGGFLAGCSAVFFMEKGNLLILLETFWYIPLSGAFISLLPVASCVCAINQGYLNFI
ncbi:MAG: hypothetical protein D3924_13175 [Candidatus Electrothrix sp. AR4]|nr:hypothetical protein [Candidatus Electrothrix sp. AR4]